MRKKEICIIELYKESFDDKKYLFDKLKEEGYKISTFSFFDKQIRYFSSKSRLIINECICLFRLLTKIKSFRNKKILCLGGQLSFFFINRIFGFFLGKHFRIYVYNFYLHAMGENKIVKHTLRFLLYSKKITLIVQSPGEIEYYKKLSKRCKVLFIPYCQDIDIEFPTSNLALNLNKNYIFSGGYTNRDYQLLIECAKIFPNIYFVLVVSHLNIGDFESIIPENITLYKDIDKSLFYSIMKEAKAVIIPLKSDVGASGQMLCLGAMSLSKPIIYSDITSINYYFKTNLKSGIPYIMGDIKSLSSAIDTISNLSKEEKQEMGENALLNYRSNYKRNNRDEAICNILIAQ